VNLYIFEARGDYYGGAVGVIADTKEAAKQVLIDEGVRRQNEFNDKENQRRKKQNEPLRTVGRDYYYNQETIRFSESDIDEVYNDRLILTHTIPVVDQPSRILFENTHEG
jgi:hypothetical protein